MEEDIIVTSKIELLKIAMEFEPPTIKELIKKADELWAFVMDVSVKEPL